MASINGSVASKGGKRENKDSWEPVFLHGELDMWIVEAKYLPNMDLATERMRKCFTLFGTLSLPFGPTQKSGRSSGKSIIYK